MALLPVHSQNDSSLRKISFKNVQNSMQQNRSKPGQRSALHPAAAQSTGNCPPAHQGVRPQRRLLSGMLDNKADQCEFYHGMQGIFDSVGRSLHNLRYQDGIAFHLRVLPAPVPNQHGLAFVAASGRRLCQVNPLHNSCGWPHGLVLSQIQ